MPTRNTEPAAALSEEQRIQQLQGPILVLGGSGFIGANLTRFLIRHRRDVYCTTSRFPAWRLEGLPAETVITTDLLVDTNLDQLLARVRPRTIFNCVAYGAYSFETDARLIYSTNFGLTERLVERLIDQQVAAYIHAGSSSEYGDNASGPSEDALPEPNSDYAVSKVASANLLRYYGRKKRLPCANLRLYSVYGPYEDSMRLIPNLIRHGVERKYPEFVDPDISRDFVYVDDVCEAFVNAALYIPDHLYGDSFNVGTGLKTTIRDVAATACRLFSIDEEPAYTMPNRQWDIVDWYANAEKSKLSLNWQARTCFQDGLFKTKQWYEALENKERYLRSSKKFGLDTVYSVSAIIACYKDNQAIPIMYDRLKKTFNELEIDHEIIFVNDGSPDDSEEVIRKISRTDRRVIGISHARNFGSQAAFRSGMEISTKNACVLLDGDLQDPPELIKEFVDRWREGYDVVYGRRIKREAPLLMQISYKLFYRVFDYFSYLRIPRDAGDFALMDKRVVRSVLRFPERDLFLRGVRAYVGYKQTGIGYVRPERMFGVTTNNLAKNIGWAKKGILSFSNVPLSILSTVGLGLFALSVVLAMVQLVLRLVFPDLSASGVTTILLATLFFGSINIFAISLLGEYIGKIFEEVKQRPHFIRRGIIRDGEVRSADEG